MADPRFFDNRGPFTLAEVCLKSGVELPQGTDGGREIADVAGLDTANDRQLTYFAGKSAARVLAQTSAGFCFISEDVVLPDSPTALLVLRCLNAPLAFANAARFFYPECERPQWSQDSSIHSTAEIEAGVVLSPGVVVGAGAEIGSGTYLGANAVIGRGVAIGRNCSIGSNVSIACAYIGDDVVILPGAQIGQPGFGFASGPGGHAKIPQLGRVIVQNRVEIGAATTIDRGALGDTVVGEGTKIDNLVQIGHNTRVGRDCIIVAQSGISGSCELGDFVVLGGQVGVADHVKIGDGARLAARCAATPGELAGGRDYGGVPARPIKQWAREVAILSQLAKRRKRDHDG